MTDPLMDPRVQVDSYVVYPTGYDSLVHSDKDMWCLTVVNGHEWGWSVRRGIGWTNAAVMNKHGDWVQETRGHKTNRLRRYSLEAALRLALRHVDTHRINGNTAVEASAYVAARMAGLETT